jgi:hypothetical protein
MFGVSIPILITLLIIFLVSTFVVACLISIYYTNEIMGHIQPIVDSYYTFMSLYQGDRYFSKRELDNWINRWSGIRSLIRSYQRYNERFHEIIGKTGPLESYIMRYRDYLFVPEEYERKIRYISSVFDDGFNILSVL